MTSNERIVHPHHPHSGKHKMLPFVMILDCRVPLNYCHPSISLTVKLNQSDLDWIGTVGSTFWSGDATNSSIWKRQKLQGLEVRSTLLVNRRALGDELYDQAFRIMKSMSLADSLKASCFLERLERD